MSDSEFFYDPATWSVNKQMVEAYEKNGYVLVRNMLSEAEIQKLRTAVESSKGIQRHAYGRSDGDRKSRMCVWNHPGDDITGVLARSPRVAGTMQELMGGDEIYHYHSKLMMKDAKSGGAFLWHQDYGYWYFNGCLYPEMASVFIPVDDCLKENGCLQVLAGSHKMGRIDHKTLGEQLGADPERVEQAKLALEHVHVEMKAGDMLFFHSNLLHTSNQNHSDLRRWVFIVAFNKKSNNPYVEHHHPRYTPLKMVDDSELLKCDVIENLEGKWFMNPTEDHSFKAGDKKFH